MSGGSPELAAQDVLDALSAATCAVRPDGVIVAVNDAWRAFADDNGGDAAACGVGVDYLAACEAVAGRDAPDAADVARGLRAVLTGAAATYRRTYAGHGPDVERWFTVRIAPLPTISGRGALVTHTDVTELHRTERALTHQAQHDGLTGLANRDLFGERLVEALAHGRHNATQVAVAFLDLDHFKRVNDSFGHANGDVLLVDVAARLRGAVREGDTLARYSGDEFVAVWRDLTSPEAVGPLGERLAQALDAPFEISGGSVRVGASIGIALAQPGQSAEEVLVAADAAMYDAKRRGRGRVRVFTSELRFGVQERMATELDLRAALGRSELVLHYQPVVDLQTGLPVAVEALARWQHPVRGLLEPDQFIPVAEDTGLIVPLGQWALRQACQDAADASGPLAGLDVAVNLSAQQLGDPDIVAHVRRSLAVNRLDPRRLLLEVTESAVVEDEQAAALALEELVALGVRVAVEDFGTGRSSLLYLRRYPISTVKIDRAFVAGIERSWDDEAICASVVSLSQAVGATCVAEGVETVEQYATLRAYGCHQGQGLLWSRAVPLGELADALSSCARVVPGAAAARSRRRCDTDPLDPLDPLDPYVTGRIRLLHTAGASLHTIAGTLNTEQLLHPAGVPWTAVTVAHYLAA